MKSINVYAPNLSRREDRRISLQGEFAHRREFHLTIIPAIEEENAALGLWKTFYAIVRREEEANSPYFVFCEDDHVFTKDYRPDVLLAHITEAEKLGADLLSGGMSCLKDPIFVCDGLFRVRSFTGMQFTVVYRRMYNSILSSGTQSGYVTDIHLSGLSKRIFVVFPFISIQKEFGYSDVTPRNNEEGRVTALFQNMRNWLNRLDRVYLFYKELKRNAWPYLIRFQATDCFIPTYVINLPERTDRLCHIKGQFAGRKEFQLHFKRACKCKIGAVGLWHSICEIIAEAESNNEDLVLICEDDHRFTSNYEPSEFLHQVYQAGCLGSDILYGGIGGYGDAIPVGHHLFWADWCWCTQFMVVYRRAFRSILTATFTEKDVADEFLSRLLPNKLFVHPFISIQKDFGYSDVTAGNNARGRITEFFRKANERLTFYSEISNQMNIP